MTQLTAHSIEIEARQSLATAVRERSSGVRTANGLVHGIVNSRASSPIPSPDYSSRNHAFTQSRIHAFTHSPVTPSRRHAVTQPGIHGTHGRLSHNIDISAILHTRPPCERLSLGAQFRAGSPQHINPTDALADPAAIHRILARNHRTAQARRHLSVI